MNVTLRALEIQDLENLQKWENDMSLWEVTGYTTPFSKEALAQFIESAQNAQSIYASGQIRLIIELDGVAVGCVDLFDFEPQNRRIGIGVLVYDKNTRRKGVAQKSIELAVSYCKRVLGIENIWAHIPITNTPSVLLFNKCGFIRSGVLKNWRYFDGKYIDVAVYQLLIHQ